MSNVLKNTETGASLFPSHIDIFYMHLGCLHLVYKHVWVAARTLVRIHLPHKCKSLSLIRQWFYVTIESTILKCWRFRPECYTLGFRSGYEAGDVLGCLIKLPQRDNIGRTHKTIPFIRITLKWLEIIIRAWY